jgi:hypothetical protein
MVHVAFAFPDLLHRRVRACSLCGRILVWARREEAFIASNQAANIGAASGRFILIR